MKCDGCTNDNRALRGAVVNGKFGQYCATCISGAGRMANTGSAQFSRDKDRSDHEVDMLQPWDPRGNPSTEFIRHYPDEAKEMFSQEELEQYG